MPTKKKGETLREVRSTKPPGIEQREDGRRKMSGYAALFNVPTVIDRGAPWQFEEVIRPGAFDRALAGNPDVVAWYNHGQGGQVPLARTPRTLRLVSDDVGLRYEIDDLPDSAASIVEAIEREDINQSSYAFSVPKDGDSWTERDGEIPLRELLDLDLHDVSPVAFAATPQTTVGVRSAADVFEQRGTPGQEPGSDDVQDVPDRQEPPDAERQKFLKRAMQTMADLRQPNKETTP